MLCTHDVGRCQRVWCLAISMQHFGRIVGGGGGACLHSGIAFLIFFACLLPASWMFLIPGLCGEWAYFVPGTEPRESAEALHGFIGFNLQPMWFLKGPTWWIWWLVPDLKEMAVFEHRKASTESWTWSDLKLESNLWFSKVLCCTAGLVFLLTLSEVWTVLSSPPFGKQHKAPQETAEKLYLYIQYNMIMMLLSLPYVFNVTSLQGVSGRNPKRSRGRQTPFKEFEHPNAFFKQSTGRIQNRIIAVKTSVQRWWVSCWLQWRKLWLCLQGHMSMSMSIRCFATWARHFFHIFHLVNSKDFGWWEGCSPVHQTAALGRCFAYQSLLDYIEFSSKILDKSCLWHPESSWYEDQQHQMTQPGWASSDGVDFVWSATHRIGIAGGDTSTFQLWQLWSPLVFGGDWLSSIPERASTIEAAWISGVRLADHIDNLAWFSSVFDYI